MIHEKEPCSSDLRPFLSIEATENVYICQKGLYNKKIGRNHYHIRNKKNYIIYYQMRNYIYKE